MTKYIQKAVAGSRLAKVAPVNPFEPSIGPEREVKVVLHGKTDVRASKAGTVADPAAQAVAIGAAWRGGVDALIGTGILMKESLIAFGDDPQQLDVFIATLVEVGLLTSKEARLGVRSSKLVKLNAIGEDADLLRHKEIAPFLGPSYSTLYQLVVLFSLMEGDREQRVKNLVGILKNCPSEITREFLSDETDRLKRSRKDKETRRPQNGGEVTAKVDTGSAASRKATDTLSGLVEAQVKVNLAVLTPSEQDRMVLSRDYADDSALERSLPLLERLQHNDDLALLIGVRESDFPVIADRLLRLCGFRRATKVLLAHNPVSWDITDAEIIVIAERGGMRLALPTEAGWADAEGELDPLAVANRLYPGAKSKLHVFASAPTEGWTSFVGDDSWAEEPSLR